MSACRGDSGRAGRCDPRRGHRRADRQGGPRTALAMMYRPGGCRARQKGGRLAALTRTPPACPRAHLKPVVGLTPREAASNSISQAASAARHLRRDLRLRASALARTTSGSRASSGRTSRPGCSRPALSLLIRICFTVISSAGRHVLARQQGGLTVAGLVLGVTLRTGTAPRACPGKAGWRMSPPK